MAGEQSEEARKQEGRDDLPVTTTTQSESLSDYETAIGPSEPQPDMSLYIIGCVIAVTIILLLGGILVAFNKIAKKSGK